VVGIATLHHPVLVDLQIVFGLRPSGRKIC
jgi:hypothetical protein